MMKRFISALLIWLFLALPGNAQTTINNLSNGSALTGTEKIPMFQTANPAVTTTPSAIKAYVNPSAPSSYLGLISTRGLVPTGPLGSGTATYQITRSMTWLRDACNSCSVLVPNFYVNTSNTEVTIGAGTVTVAVATSPAGSYTTCATSVALPNGITVVPCPGLTLAKGSQAWVCMIDVNSNGIVFAGMEPGTFDPTDGWTLGTGTPPTVSSCPTVPDSSGNRSAGWRPLGLVGQTTLPSVVIVGDSRAVGLYDYVNSGLSDTGNVARFIGPQFAYSNASVTSTFLSGYLSGSHAYRDILIGYASHVIDELGVNDITTGANAATVAANRTTFAGLYPSAIIMGATIEPVATSSDNFATTANQTATNVAVLTQFNKLERFGISGESFVFDIAMAADPYQTNIWPVSPNPAATTSQCTGSFTGSASSAGVLTITAVGSGALTVGCPLITGVATAGYVTSFISGTGNTGTYGFAPNIAFGSTTLTPGEFPTVDGTHETPSMNSLIANRLLAVSVMQIAR